MPAFVNRGSPGYSSWLPERDDSPIPFGDSSVSADVNRLLYTVRKNYRPAQRLRFLLAG